MTITQSMGTILVDSNLGSGTLVIEPDADIRFIRDVLSITDLNVEGTFSVSGVSLVPFGTNTFSEPVRFAGGVGSSCRCGRTASIGSIST